MTKEEYVKSWGLSCPHCGSTNIQTIGPIEADGDGICAWQDVECNDCQSAWTDEYNLVGYDHLTTEENN